MSAPAEHPNGCPHANFCPLYEVFTMPSTAGIWKAMYCHVSKHSECKRFIMACQGLSVPLNLLPNGQTLGGGAS